MLTILKESSRRCDYVLHNVTQVGGKSFYVWGRDDVADQGVHMHYFNTSIEPPLEEQVVVLRLLREERGGNECFCRCFG